MSDNWQVGDLAVCAKRDKDCRACSHMPPDDNAPPDGTILTVGDVSTYSKFLPRVGLWFGPDDGPWCSCGFRKIRHDEHEDCEPEFVTLLRRSKTTVRA